MFWIFLAIIFADQASAFSTYQTTTSAGYLRDASQTARFPVFHTGSFRGLYNGGVEARVDFVLNRDFATDEWRFFPDQVNVGFPLLGSGASERQFNMIAGRQLFAENFDLALLDGARASFDQPSLFNFDLHAGWLRTLDMNELEANEPIVGAIAGKSVATHHLKAGFSGRGERLQTKLVAASLLTEHQGLPLSPRLLLKGEASADTGAVDQSLADLAVTVASGLDADINFMHRNPRPTDYRDRTSLLYRAFAVSASESLGAGVSWAATGSSLLRLNGRQVQFNSGVQREVSHLQEVSYDFPLSRSSRLAPVATHIAGYGGELWDGGLRWVIEVSDLSRVQTDLDVGYLEKVNGVRGWIHHGRVSYETSLSQSVKTWVSAQVERNHYFEFNARAMAYVTTYL
ncbi:MAG TPA: hypothetical protein VFV50_14295 [Bdellovibrionales bacterium]|nr:hypothetical protein [Bdellovibrionales bacterium]